MIRYLLLTGSEIRQIAGLKKTMHLVPVRYNRQVQPAVPLPCPYRADAIHPVDTWKWETETRHGREVRHKIPASDEPRLFVQISSIARTTLGDLGYSDARHLGHRTTLELAHAWLTDNDAAYPADRPDDDTIARQFRRHASRAVWLISMQIAEGPRFLAARGDYTFDPREAAYGEPEPVDAAMQEKITLGKLHAADQRRRTALRSAAEDIRAAISHLEPHATLDRQVASRARLLRRQLDGVNRLLEQEAA